MIQKSIYLNWIIEIGRLNAITRVRVAKTWMSQLTVSSLSKWLVYKQTDLKTPPCI